MSRDPTFWILSRAAGITAYGLLTTSMLAGLVLKSRPLGNRVKPVSVTDLHRFLATLALGAVAVHGLTLLADTTVRVTPLALVVPGAIPYRPAATGVGVVVAELALVVYVSFSVRKRIGARTWRRLHWLTYLVWSGATAHGVLAGTDTPSPWLRDAYLSSLGVVVFATAWRALARSLVQPRRAREPRAQRVLESSPVE